MPSLSALREVAQLIARNLLERAPAERLFYRGVKPVSAEDLSSAVRKSRPNSLPGSEWWTDNPMLASSYGPLVRMAELSRAPDVALSAAGRPWDAYFLMPAPGGAGYSVRGGLRPGEFREAFQAPSVRDILVQHIEDQGPYSWPAEDKLQREFEDLTGLPASWGSTLLVKPESDILRPRTPVLKARGGLAQFKECSCGQ